MDRDFDLSDRLRPEPRRGVEAVLDSRDLAFNVRGAAGTGKSTGAVNGPSFLS
jgi:hypothetical protein